MHICTSMAIGEQHWTCACYSRMQGLRHAIIAWALAPSGVRSTHTPSAEMNLGFPIQEAAQAMSEAARSSLEP